MSQLTRFAVWTPKGWLGANTGSRGWPISKPSYRLHAEPKDARVFFRKADATKAMNAMGGGEVVPVALWFGPHPAPSQPLCEHNWRPSDSSLYDLVCRKCGMTD